MHGAVGDINIPGKHAFLFERILEFNASVPYAGFSGAFLEQMNRPGRFDKEARRRAFDTMEALFCLLPEAKKVRSQINPVAYKTAGIVPSGIRKSLPTNQDCFYLRVSNCRALDIPLPPPPRCMCSLSPFYRCTVACALGGERFTFLFGCSECTRFTVNGELQSRRPGG